LNQRKLFFFPLGMILLVSLVACCNPAWRKEALKAGGDAIAEAAKADTASNKALDVAQELEASVQKASDAAQRAENAASRAENACDKAESIVQKMEEAFARAGKK
jgi:hypothetical protein